MTTKTPRDTTPVIFRIDKRGGVVALFPATPADVNGSVTTYEHHGQHGAASYHHVMTTTRPATTAESAALHHELEAICGYHLKVCQRRSHAHERTYNQTVENYLEMLRRELP